MPEKKSLRLVDANPGMSVHFQRARWDGNRPVGSGRSQNGDLQVAVPNAPSESLKLRDGPVNSARLCERRTVRYLGIKVDDSLEMAE